MTLCTTAATEGPGRCLSDSSRNPLSMRHGHSGPVDMHATALGLTAGDATPLERVKAHVLDAAFPCLAARSAINSRRAHFGSYGPLGSHEPQCWQALCDALTAFTDTYPDPGEARVTFIALLDDDVHDEVEFEQRLWCHLQLLHDCDRLQFEWAHHVSSDPDSCNFSFSIGRRKYDKLQRSIRSRDVALQGDADPVLARFGEASEAMQHSARAESPGWQCPFRPGVQDAD